MDTPNGRVSTFTGCPINASRGCLASFPGCLLSSRQCGEGQEATALAEHAPGEHREQAVVLGGQATQEW